MPNEPLAWDYSPECVAGPRAAVSGMAVCRNLGRGDTLDKTLLPGYSPGASNGQIQCDATFFYGIRQGPGQVELLCRGERGAARC